MSVQTAAHSTSFYFSLYEFINIFHRPCSPLNDRTGKTQLNFWTIPISCNIMKETLWPLSLYTNVPIIKAVKLFHWSGFSIPQENGLYLTSGLKDLDPNKRTYLRL